MANASLLVFLMEKCDIMIKVLIIQLKAMKKTFTMLAVFVLVSVFSGCTSQQAVQTPTQKENQAEVKSENGSVVSSIKDAMGLGKKMKCSYSMGNGESKFESTVFIDGKRYKSSTMVDGKLTYAYFDQDTMYSWMDGQKTGTKMTMSCLDDLKNSLSADLQESMASQIENPEDKFDNANNATCVSADDADFSLPADVVFSDQCAMMKQVTEQMKNIKIPSMPNLPNIPGQ